MKTGPTCRGFNSTFLNTYKLHICIKSHPHSPTFRTEDFDLQSYTQGPQDTTWKLQIYLLNYPIMKLLSALLLLAASTNPLLALPQGEIEMPPLCPLLQAQHELLVQHINDPLYCDPHARMLDPHDCSRKRTIRKFLRNERCRRRSARMFLRTGQLSHKPTVIISATSLLN